MKKIIVACPECYKSKIKSCSTTLVLKAGLTPNASYYWVLENKFSKLYQRQVNSENDGSLIIDLTVLPAGATIENSGSFTLQVHEGANYLNRVPLTFNAKQYECVLIDFIDVDDTNPHNVIQ